MEGYVFGVLTGDAEDSEPKAKSEKPKRARLQEAKGQKAKKLRSQIRSASAFGFLDFWILGWCLLTSQVSVDGGAAPLLTPIGLSFGFVMTSKGKPKIPERTPMNPTSTPNPPKPP